MPVPPFTYVKATFTVIETDYYATWTTEIDFSGWTLAKAKKGNDVVIASVYDIYRQYPDFSCWKNSADDYGCHYTSKGVYYGVEGAKSTLDTESDECLRGDTQKVVQSLLSN